MATDTRQLRDLRGIGRKMLEDFQLLGISSVPQLKTLDAQLLYNRMCELTQTRQDPCVLDTYRCAIEQARNPTLAADQTDWWYWSRLRKAGLLLVLCAASLSAQSATYAIHSILHNIGEERFEIKPNSDGTRTLTTTSTLNDRGNVRTTTATLTVRDDYSPIALTVNDKPRSNVFTGASPVALQFVLLHNFLITKQAPAPIEIKAVQRDGILVHGKAVTLQRYIVRNLMFGDEVVWTTLDGDLVAAMTFAGGLPMEALRTDILPALDQLYKLGVAQQIKTRFDAAPIRTGDYAIVHANLIDGIHATPTPNATVVVKNGRIASVGQNLKLPAGLVTIDAKGQTLLPGLWEMHIHYSGPAFGPALLAAGITTARDCGGEFEYLVAQRNAIEMQSSLGPRLLLAGLVDSGGIKAFGHITADTPEEGRAVVRKYHAARFQQIKLYTFLAPDVVTAIADEAHKLGMSVTGHVPNAFDAYQGIEAGMDQINHLGPVSRLMRDPEASAKTIAFLQQHHTVVDPTIGWGEMASHSKAVDVTSFEPGIDHAPNYLDSKFRNMGSDTTADQMQSRISQNLATVGALHKAGIPIVPGSDTGLVGYGLIRELELYVKAGMTPFEAIQSATIVSAKAMKLDKESGSIEPGKNADLILIVGDPLANISVLRKVTRVMTQGRLYESDELWKSVGFHPAK